MAGFEECTAFNFHPNPLMESTSPWACNPFPKLHAPTWVARTLAWVSLALLSACADNPEPSSPPATTIPAAPVSPSIAYGVKSHALSWNAVEGATHYEVFEDVDGPGPQEPTAMAGPLSAPSHSVHHTVLLHERLNVQYAVRACNSAGCSALSTGTAPDLNQAIGYFKAGNTGKMDEFGGAVALSADGATLAVAAHREDGSANAIDGPDNDGASSAGAVYLFVRQDGAWKQQAYIKASNAGAGDQFGFTIALSADGNTLAVGAPEEDSHATGVNNTFRGDSPAGNNSGAAYVFVRTGDAWSQQAYVKASNTQLADSFGFAVALSADGNTLAVGAIGENSAATGVGGDQLDTTANAAGAVYVFARTGDTWAQQEYVKASNTDAGDRFGSAVALSADGNTLAVGATYEASLGTGPNADPNNDAAPQAGAAYVYTRSGTTWAWQAYLKASNTGGNNHFGHALALSADGDTLAVGAPFEDSKGTGIDGDKTNAGAEQSGAVYVFTRDEAAWTLQAYVKASDTAAFDNFGTSVSLSTDGNTLAVGAFLEDSAATGIGGNQTDASGDSTGAAYLFQRTGTRWAQAVYLKPSNGKTEQRFGSSVHVLGDGRHLAVGATGESSSATGIGGNQNDTGSDDSGAVYLF